MSYDNLLIPLDGSAIADEAVAEAKKVLDKGRGKIHLLSVIELPIMQLEGYGEIIGTLDIMERLKERFKLLLREKTEKLLAEGVEASWSVREGLPHEEIVEAAREFNSDAIVMTTHGRTGIAHWIMGSVAERVVRSAPCPVLIVRGHF